MIESERIRKDCPFGRSWLARRPNSHQGSRLFSGNCLFICPRSWACLRSNTTVYPKQNNMHILEDVCGQNSIKEIQINWVCTVKHSCLLTILENWKSSDQQLLCKALRSCERNWRPWNLLLQLEPHSLTASKQMPSIALELTRYLISVQEYIVRDFVCFPIWHQSVRQAFMLSLFLFCQRFSTFNKTTSKVYRFTFHSHDLAPIVKVQSLSNI